MDEGLVDSLDGYYRDWHALFHTSFLEREVYETVYRRMLDKGAVLSRTGAKLRRVKSGGKLRLDGNRTLRVSGVVDDALIGGYEVALDHTLARDYGIRLAGLNDASGEGWLSLTAHGDQKSVVHPPSIRRQPRPSIRLLRPGSPAAPGEHHLPLLGSPPGGIRGSPPRRTRPSTPLYVDLSGQHRASDGVRPR